MKPRPATPIRPPAEDGDLRAFARALVAVAVRVAQERRAVVQSEHPQTEQKAA